MMEERAVFDPDEIRAVCQANLAAGLRAIADALNAGELTGTLYGVTGNGFCKLAGYQSACHSQG